MKQLVISLSAFFLSIMCFAGGGANKIYQDIENEYDCFSIGINKTWLDFFDLDLDINNDSHWVTGDFKSGKLLILDEPKKAEEIKRRFIKAGYEEIEVETDDEEDEIENTYLLAAREGKYFTEIHFIHWEDDQLILFSITGKIKVEEKE